LGDAQQTVHVAFDLGWFVADVVRNAPPRGEMLLDESLMAFALALHGRQIAGVRRPEQRLAETVGVGRITATEQTAQKTHGARVSTVALSISSATATDSTQVVKASMETRAIVLDREWVEFLRSASAPSATALQQKNGLCGKVGVRKEELRYSEKI